MGSALHVVAAAGDGRRNLDSATVIRRRASHLLTARNGKGDTPLHCAARAGNTDMVAHLIVLAGGEDEVRALVGVQNMRGETALHEAVCFGDTKMVGVLMDADRGLAAVVAVDGTSPMYLACSLGRGKLARELHRRGDRISYSGPEGQNALHAAVIHNKNKGIITKLLLDREKDLVNQRDINGSTPMHFAASAADPSFQFTNVVFTAINFERTFLGSNLLPQKCLTKVYTWREHPLPQLLEAEPSLAFQADIHGSFPVHVAASVDSMVFIIVLLTRYPGCAGLLDGQGRTFLHVAVENKRFHVVKFACHSTRSFKQVQNVQDKDGNTALHMAVIEGELDIFRCFIRIRDVKINLQNNEGHTPMDLALGKVHSGFYFGLTARRRILGMLSLIVGIGSVLVATATFAAAFAMPGGVRSLSDASAKAPAGTPVLAGRYAFDGFVICNTLAFICSTLATFSLVYCGVAAFDIQRRFKLVSFSLALLLCAARSFCAAFAFSLYLLLAQVEHGTAVAACVMTSLALLDGLWFLLATFDDTSVLFSRRTKVTLLKLATGFIANIILLFWP